MEMVQEEAAQVASTPAEVDQVQAELAPAARVVVAPGMGGPEMEVQEEMVLAARDPSPLQLPIHGWGVVS